MSSDKRSFNHITVSADVDDDDVVIQAGAADADAPVPEYGSFNGDSFDDSDVFSGADGGSDVAREWEAAETDERRGGEAPHAPGQADAGSVRSTGRETPRKAASPSVNTLEDLEGSKMGGVQKAIIAVAVIGLVAFAVYYICFM